MEINDQIKITKDCSGRIAAIRLARKHIKEKGYDLKETSGYIYVNGPKVSDLLILEPCVNIRADGRTMPKLRACTGQEWGKYFYTFLCERDRTG